MFKSLLNINANHSSSLQVEKRYAKRVTIKLPVTMVLGKNETFTAQTSNFSETGILVHKYSGPELQINRLVAVRIHGILTDEDEKHGYHHFSMRVVRQYGTCVALRFL
jgi:c-di-GMP-binding flagellar brake protein YcgR